MSTELLNLFYLACEAYGGTSFPEYLLSEVSRRAASGRSHDCDEYRQLVRLAREGAELEGERAQEDAARADYWSA